MARAGHVLIGDVIDTDQEEGTLVAPGVSDQLDALKHTYHGLPDLLTKVVQAELARVPRHLSDALTAQLWSTIYMPQVEGRSWVQLVLLPYKPSSPHQQITKSAA